MAIAITALPGCGSKRPTDPDTLPPFIQWLSPGVSSAVLEFPTDTVTVEFAAADDGGLISQVRVYLQDAPVATLTSSPFRYTLNLSILGHNRPGRVYATATDPTGKLGSTRDTLRFMVRPKDTVTWTRLFPARQPAPRVGHSLSLDVTRERAILFGGESFAEVPLPEVVNDTWIFDFVTNAWDSLALTSPPSERKDHGAGVVGGTLVVLMGRYRGDTDSMLQDYALLDLGSMVWATNLGNSILSQPLRSMSTTGMASRLYAFGGSSDPSFNFPATDSTLRVFDLFDTSWTSYTGAFPKTRVDAILAADLEGARLILYGGAAGGGFSALPADASHYRFNPATATWASDPQLPQVVPPLTQGAGVCDSFNNRVLVWGGKDNAGGLPTDVWEFSLGNLRWSRLATAGAPPAGRTEHEMVIDQAGSRAIMFGGRVGGSAVAETWELRW